MTLHYGHTLILFAGWIYVGNRQAYFIEICDQILTALFCVVGIGMAPFRAVDTYHMIYIAHYHFLTWRLRREQALPDLQDPNDLPEPQEGTDLELARGKSLENVVLIPEQQAKLIHHQTKFSRSHTFYKPHETFTHHAFSVQLLMAIVILLDCHSLLQMALGGTTVSQTYDRIFDRQADSLPVGHILSGTTEGFDCRNSLVLHFLQPFRWDYYHSG